MISIPFDYKKYPVGHIEEKIEMLEWVRENSGIVKRRTGRTDILGVIESINFEDELDAIAFRIKFGL